jgi:GTP-binding protein
MQGLGTGDLLDKIVEVGPESDPEPSKDDPIRLALIGLPNVGKSSLVNKFLGSDRVIVSDIAGTTRDAIDLPLEFEGRKLILVDTAGLRRQAKVGESLEYYMALRSQRAAERADVALVICDASEGVTSQDFKIAEMAMKSGCATALVLNKWDLQNDVGSGTGAIGPDELQHERVRVNRKLRLRPRVLTTSAKTGRHIERILVEAVGLADRSRGRIQTAQLNRFISDVVAQRQPPAAKNRRYGQQRLKLIYMTQTGERPPRFSIQVNSHGLVTRDYAYYVENRMRERYRMEGIPLMIDFVERNERRGRPERRDAASRAAAAATEPDELELEPVEIDELDEDEFDGFGDEFGELEQVTDEPPEA